MAGHDDARVWRQSFVPPREQAPYIERPQRQLDAFANPSVRFEVRGLEPPDHFFHPLTEFRCAAQSIRNALEAERAGYDGFVIGHFQEPELLKTRGSLEIPVIALGEAALLTACGMGRRIGLVTIDPAFIDWHERQVSAHGLGERLAGGRDRGIAWIAMVRAIRRQAGENSNPISESAARMRVANGLKANPCAFS